MKIVSPTFRWNVLFVLVILLSLFLAGCAGKAPPRLPKIGWAAPALAVSSSRTASPTARVAPSETPTSAPTATSTRTPLPTGTPAPTATRTSTPTVTPTAPPPNPLSIEYMSRQSYPGSDIVIEQTLPAGEGYSRYVASYLSDGLKIYGLLTVPDGDKPASGWPVIIFNHGHITPELYRTTERYVAYVDAIARRGYIVFKSDYRGHGSSEGTASGSYGSPDYTIDVLNALSSLKRYKDADPGRIGMWGHSMGGGITLRAMVTVPDIKAGVIWAGTVESYPDMFKRSSLTPTPNWMRQSLARRWRADLVAQYGTPEDNPQFWESISPNFFLQHLSGPVQLHHGTRDQSVPIVLSETLKRQIDAAGKPAEYYTYEGDNHNISNNFTLAMERSIEFFDEYVKNAPAGGEAPQPSD